MNEFERAARGQRASQCEEFIGPILSEVRASYMERMEDVAVKELDPKLRAEKITALATALRILNNLETGIAAVVRDGSMAEQSIIKVENIERMGVHKRRLFDIAPLR